MLIAQNIGYTHPDKEQLFENISFGIVKGDKIAITGNNGTGKSTLLRILAGCIAPSSGSIQTSASRYYVPQHFGNHNHYTVAEAMGVSTKLRALRDILAGNTTEENFALLKDDWTIEERCKEAMDYLRIKELDMDQPLSTLSGGQKTKTFLAGIRVHQPQIVLADEPTNHMDTTARRVLYDYIAETKDTLVVVSHDRTLLNLLHTTWELSPKGITVYGGNYDFYTDRKAEEAEARSREIEHKEKELRKAKETARSAMERQQRTDARGKKKQEKAGLPTIAMNTLRNNAEKSTAKTKEVHAEKTGSLAAELQHLREAQPSVEKMKAAFRRPDLHHGKILFRAEGINISYGGNNIWANPLSFEIRSGERIAIKGANGSGKTTLVKSLQGLHSVSSGNLDIQEAGIAYIDQEYAQVDDNLSVYEQAQRFNTTALSEHEIKIWLTRFLFTKELWHRRCATLSGGEKMRLALCSVTIGNIAPDIMILDEPTNNLDIGNMEILTEAVNTYNGTVIAISHDEYFLKAININRSIIL